MSVMRGEWYNKSGAPTARERGASGKDREPCASAIGRLLVVLLACAFIPRGCNDDAVDPWTVLRLQPSDTTALPAPFAHVGLWMAPTRGYQWDHNHETYTPMLAAWRAAGADGVMLGCADLQGARWNLGRSQGYPMRLLGGPGLQRVSEWEQFLADTAVRNGMTMLYLDDGWFAWAYDKGASTPWTPFDAAGFWRNFDSLLTVAERFDKDVGVNVYEIEGIRMMLDTVRAYDARHAPFSRRYDRLWIFTGARYFDAGSPKYLTWSDDVRAFVRSCGFPMARMLPWMAPSCGSPRGASHIDVEGCLPEWTFHQILHLAGLGYGGVYVYPANGLDAEHRDKLLLALWACGNLQLPARPRPRTWGELRAYFADTARFEPLLAGLRSIGMPTHLPCWEWE
jgi:hypothetical protein